MSTESTTLISRYTPEPWPALGTGLTTVALALSDYNRARQCVNAFAGVADPEKELARLRRFEHLANEVTGPIIGKLTQELETLRKESEANKRFIADLEKNWTDAQNELETLRVENAGIQATIGNQFDELAALRRKVAAAETLVNEWANPRCDCATTPEGTECEYCHRKYAARAAYQEAWK